MDGNLSSIWDRINNLDIRLTPHQYQRAVKRDVETLLNTRIALPPHAFAALPHCRDSLLTFGLPDFAQLCLSSSADRSEICQHLKTSLQRHEPRLSNIRVSLGHEKTINKLGFVISAQLPALAGLGRFQFDVTLEPSSLHYSVR